MDMPMAVSGCNCLMEGGVCMFYPDEHWPRLKSWIEALIDLILKH